MAGIGQAVTGLTGLVTTLLGQHTARLQNAENENQAVGQVIPAYDADLAEIQSAYTTGQATASECLTALQQMQAKIYNYLKAQVGKPGTAWSGTPTYAPCSKSCTVGCCIYYNDLNPGLLACMQALGGPAVPSVFAVLVSGTTATIPKVFGSTGNYSGVTTRNSYTLNFMKPTTIPSVAGTIMRSVNPAQVAMPGANNKNGTLGSSRATTVPTRQQNAATSASNSESAFVIFAGVTVVGLIAFLAMR